VSGGGTVPAPTTPSRLVTPERTSPSSIQVEPTPELQPTCGTLVTLPPASTSVSSVSDGLSIATSPFTTMPVSKSPSMSRLPNSTVTVSFGWSEETVVVSG